VRVPIDGEFRAEAERYALRFTCRDCFHFRNSGRPVPAEPGREDAPSAHRSGACAHEWPNELHLEPPAEGAKEVIFCKEFELC